MAKRRKPKARPSPPSRRPLPVPRQRAARRTAEPLDRHEDSGNNACTVRSKFVMIEYRRDSQRLFAGTAFHRLVQADGGIFIASKRVNLVNCDAPLDGIVVPF